MELLINVLLSLFSCLLHEAGVSASTPEHSLKITSKPEVTVSSPVGIIRGSLVTVNLPGRPGVQLAKFLGIPYGQPPTGPLRFAKPVPRQPFPEPLLALTYGPACPQDPALIPFFVPGDSVLDEDCLSLNVFTVAPQGHIGSRPLPVMVFIYGGSYLVGQSKVYDGSHLSAWGEVVVVTLNYRLGPLGFLSTGDDQARGNWGLWDQRLALLWVRQNIRAFGGDPDNITLFGESAGAASVVYQAMFPGNKGLIKRIISESGLPSCPWAFRIDNSKYATALAVRMGCHDVTSSSAILDCLRRQPFRAIASNASVASSSETLFRPEWVPVVDGEFVTLVPVEELIWPCPQSGCSASVQIFQHLDAIFGVNSDDGEIIVRTSLAALATGGNSDNLTFGVSADNLRNKVLPAIVDDFLSNIDKSSHKTPGPPPRDDPRAREMLRALTDLYTDQSRPQDAQSSLTNLLALSSHYNFFSPALTSTYLHAAGSGPKGTTYLYLLDSPATDQPLPQWRHGAAHADDLVYVFGFPDSMKQAFGFQSMPQAGHWELSAAVMTYWTNFAKTGDPNRPEKMALPWPQFDLTGHLLLPLTTSMSSIPHSAMSGALASFWLNYLPRLIQGQEFDGNGTVHHFNSSIIFG